MLHPISNRSVLPAPVLRRRHGAIGKAIIVWLATGSVVAGLGAYLVFGAMGC